MMDINGKELKITPASFSVAMALQKAVMKAVKGSHIELPDSLEDMDAGGLVDAVLSVASDDEVEALLFKAAERVIVGEQKVDRDFFEDVDNRQHYYPIMTEIIKVNLGPFVQGVVSRLMDSVPDKVARTLRKSK